MDGWMEFGGWNGPGREHSKHSKPVNRCPLSGICPAKIINKVTPGHLKVTLPYAQRATPALYCHVSKQNI